MVLHLICLKIIRKGKGVLGQNSCKWMRFRFKWAKLMSVNDGFCTIQWP